jgi:nitrogen PTS system EIIA component
MKITEMLKKEFILEELLAQTKREALAEMVGLFDAGGSRVDPEKVLHVLLEREKLGSTGIGDGIAIPHGKIDGIEEMVVAFGRSRRGIDFEAMDGRPVHLFFLLIAPENSSGLHLKALAKISRMLKDAPFRQRLLEAPETEDLYRVIAEKDEES